MTQIVYHDDKIFCCHKYFFLKNTSKLAYQYLFNVFILINIFFKLKEDPKMRAFKSLEKFWKPGKIKIKTSGNPVFIIKRWTYNLKRFSYKKYIAKYISASKSPNKKDAAPTITFKTLRTLRDCFEIFCLREMG